MHRNTMLVVIGLGIVAASVGWVNITGRNSEPMSTPPVPSTSVGPTPTPILLSYSNPLCKVSFSYPDTYNKVELDNNGGAAFARKDSSVGSLTFLCQENFPKPKELDTAEIIKFGSVSAYFVNPDSTKSAQTNGRLFVTHPISKRSISISGTKDIFEPVMESLNIQ